MGVNLLTMQGVADKCRVSYQTVRAWIQEGKLKAAKFGSIWRVSEDDLEEFVRSSQNHEKPKDDPEAA